MWQFRTMSGRSQGSQGDLAKANSMIDRANGRGGTADDQEDGIQSGAFASDMRGRTKLPTGGRKPA